MTPYEVRAKIANERLADILHLYKDECMTLTQLSFVLGISRQRVEQILKRTSEYIPYKGIHYHVHRRPRIVKRCKTCDKELFVVPSRSRQKYCSVKCHGFIKNLPPKERKALLAKRQLAYYHRVMKPSKYWRAKLALYQRRYHQKKK